MTTVTIRRARPSDAEIIAANNQAMAMETEGKQLDQATVNKGCRAIFEDESKGFYLVAEKDDKVVGQLMITTEWSDWRNGDFWWIQSVYVPPDQRKQGIFRALYDQLVKMARQAPNVCGLRLYTHETNQNAHATYRSLGMKQTPYLAFEVEF
jgi:ribosomal protein S18 acetylase RimI-like enzyme